MAIEREKEFERMFGMIYICNFENENVEKYQKALRESRADGMMLGIAFDRKGNPAPTQSGLYFKNKVEYNKFIHICNCINCDEPYQYHDLTEVDTQELLDELNLRMNKGMER